MFCLSVIGAASAHDSRPMSGNPGIDLMQETALSDTLQSQTVHQKKSMLLAIGASAILPGAGQAYVGNWWRAAAFFTAEVAGVTAALVYNNAANKQTIFFQNYADGDIDPGAGYTAKWDVVKYAEWVNQYVVQMHIDSAQVQISTDNTKVPWSRVNWDQLNKLEKEIGDNNAASGFSHTLPHHGDQQYYELIGKYPQFGHGWDDANALDLSSSEVRTPHLLYYSAERGKANDLYSYSTWATIAVILNHLGSAIEAAISSHAYNKTVQVGFRPETYADGTMGISPCVDFRIGF